jgi:hypothetical protein
VRHEGYTLLSRFERINDGLWHFLAGTGVLGLGQNLVLEELERFLDLARLEFLVVQARLTNKKHRDAVDEGGMPPRNNPHTTASHHTT